MQIFLLLILFFFTTIPVFGQQSQLSQRWVCLKVDWCLDQVAFAQGKYLPNPLCAPGSDGKPLANGHRVRLTAKSDAKLLPNADTYIVECLATTIGQVCTTGNTENDTRIYGKDNALALKTSDDYQFQGVFKSDGVTAASAPLKSKASGDIDPVEWQSYSKGNARKFLALNFFDPNEGNSLLGRGAEQQGTFSFEVQSNTKDCVSISWDPYGRVFDSKTLEPIPNASVTLLKKKANGLYSQLLSGEILGGAIENPYMTNESGYYSFVVPDGTYKLSASNQNYIFPSDRANLNEEYIKAYSDLYPASTGVEIVQAGTVQHRDIPLDPKSGIGINYPVKLLNYFYNLDKSTNKILIEGLVSHPLARLRFYSIKPKGEFSQLLIRYKLLKSIQADRFGKFKTEIDQSSFEPTEVFGDMELEKVDLTNNTTSKQPMLKKLFSVEAAQSSINIIRFNPILNSLKGFAYDAKKNILPRVTVGVYLTYANKPYYETKTDEKGYYEIPSERLPNSPYNIKYSTIIGGLQTTSTSKFVAQNNVYLEKNKIDLNTNKGSRKDPSIAKNPLDTDLKDTLTKSGDKNFFSKSEGTNFSTSPSVKQPSLTQGSLQNNSRLLIIIVILLLLIATAGGLLGFYLIKKNKN